MSYKKISNINKYIDQDILYISKKTEKIVSVLYMISNFFDSREPVKWEIRDKGLALVSNTLKLMNVSMPLREALVRNILSDLYSLMALFEIAYRSGFVSQMNYDIVKLELDGLLKLFDDYELNQFSMQKYSINKKDFDLKKDGNLLDEPQSRNSHKRHTKRHLPTHKKDYSGSDSIESPYNKKDIDSGILLSDKDKKDNDRSSKILEIIKEKQKVSIKDIAQIITDCSEKTIQRELQQLINDKVLKREGERRWSLYSFI
jgi:hypothetical protein